MSRFRFTLALLLALPGCGGAIMERRADPLPSDRAREIESLEESITEEEAHLEALDPHACPERCHSVEAICEASERICQIASELDDAGVDARCAHANHQCDEARSEATAGCSCAMPASAGVAACDAIRSF